MIFLKWFTMVIKAGTGEGLKKINDCFYLYYIKFTVRLVIVGFENYENNTQNSSINVEYCIIFRKLQSYSRKLSYIDR